MALVSYQNVYAPSEDPNGIPEKWALEGHGVPPREFQNSVTITNGDSIGSTYCLCKDVSADDILYKLDIETDAITAATACQIGIYDADLNTVYTVNSLATALDLHTAVGKATPLDGLNALTHEQTKQTIATLAGHTLLNKRGRYDIVLTLTQAATATGVVTARGRLLPAG